MLETMCKRRSIRSFTGEPITDEELALILKAAQSAPIGRKEYDTLTITVVKSKEFMEAFDKGAGEFFGDPNKHPLYGAPMIIIVSSALCDGPRVNTYYSNAACVVENMALEAVELGVGACHIWGAMIALRQMPQLVEKLGIPADQTPCCGLVLGKTTEKYEPREIPADRIKVTCVE